MKETKWITRKEVAALCPPLSVDQIRRNEAAWGLDAAKKKINRRVIWYDRAKVVSILTSLGLNSTAA